ANIAAHNVTRQLPTRRATQVLRTGTESASGQSRRLDRRATSDLSPTPDMPLRRTKQRDLVVEQEVDELRDLDVVNSDNGHVLGVMIKFCCLAPFSFNPQADTP